MYCSKCGTVNPEHAVNCIKCGRDLEQRLESEETAVDVALFARPSRPASLRPAGSIFSRIALMIMVGAIVILAPMMIFWRQAGTSGISRPGTVKLNTAPAAGESEGLRDFESGLGLAPRAPAEVVARDVAKKANAARLKMVLEQFYAMNDRYPESFEELDVSTLGFTPSPESYSYTQTDDGHGYVAEIILESDNVSGADVVVEGHVTKLVLRNY